MRPSLGGSGASMRYRRPVSYRAFFGASLVVFAGAELILVWRGADILAIAAVPLVVGLTIQVAIRLVPGWQDELGRLRDPERHERQRQWRRPILLLTALVIGLSLIGTLMGYGLRRP